jgi:hypothetical protein
MEKRSSYRTIGILIFLFVISQGFTPPRLEQSPKSLTPILQNLNYCPKSYREILYVLPEAGCASTTQAVIRFLKAENPKNFSILVIAKRKIAIDVSERFEGLQEMDLMFVETDFAESKGIFQQGPSLVFIENDEIVQDIKVNCDNFELAKSKAQMFLQKPYFDDYKNMHQQSSRL